MTLYSVLHTTQRPQILTNIVVVILATVLLIISAKISIPFYPVPLTMQTFVVVGLGMALGSKRGVAAVLLYLAEGAIGLPVFAGTPHGGIGLTYMIGSTGGYLFGFIIAAYISGFFAERGWDSHILKAFFVTFLSTAVIFIPGILWLGVVFGWDKPIIEWGLTPFIWGAIFKASLGAIVFPITWKYLKSKGIVE